MQSVGSVSQQVAEAVWLVLCSSRQLAVGDTLAIGNRSSIYSNLLNGSLEVPSVPQAQAVEVEVGVSCRSGRAAVAHCSRAALLIFQPTL